MPTPVLVAIGGDLVQPREGSPCVGPDFRVIGWGDSYEYVLRVDLEPRDGDKMDYLAQAFALKWEKEKTDPDRHAVVACTLARGRLRRAEGRWRLVER